MTTTTMTSKGIEETELVLDPAHQQGLVFQDQYGAAGAENKWNKNGFGEGKSKGKAGICFLLSTWNEKD